MTTSARPRNIPAIATSFVLAVIIVFEEWGWRRLADLLGRLADERRAEEIKRQELKALRTGKNLPSKAG